jgi:light-regulated signal transduction histidine kinase (bacteriophytochrome)
VGSFVSLLEMKHGEQLDADAKEYIRYAVDGVERMKRLINALLEYSRVEYDRGEPRQVDTTKVMANIRDNLKYSINQAGAEFRCHELPVVKGDEIQLSQLFQNLVANAIKFRGDKAPKVTVSATEDQAHFLFAVKDEGIGIAEKYKERVFQIFQRLHSSAQYEGAGLGLAICKKIVELHGGKIWFESAPGVGTTFYFTLPK